LARVTFLGTGDATCADGTHASVLYAGQKTILLDCGPTVPQPLQRVLPDPEALDAVWISHQHADHCFGLPTLLLTLRLAGRKKSLEIVGGSGSSAFIRALLELGYPGSFRPEKCFAISCTEIEPGRRLRFGDLMLSTVRTQHRVTCHALRIDEGNCSIGVSGDGKLVAHALELYRAVDLVVHECQWATKVTDDHSCVSDLRPLLGEVKVGRIAVIHYDRHERESISEQASKQLGDRAWLPHEGEVWEL
jgi:ribonuclease Z